MLPTSQIKKTLKDKLPEIIFYFVLYSLLLITFISLLNPFSPIMLSLGLDESWAFALISSPCPTP